MTTARLPVECAAARRAQRALVLATAFAVLAHGVGWGLWRQHAGQGVDARGESVHLSFRTVGAVVRTQPMPLPVVDRTDAGHVTDPTLAMPAVTNRHERQAPYSSNSDGPVMVESSFDEALQAVSAHAQNAAAAAGNAQDPFAINPDAYWPADTLDQSPQLAGPWQLNEAAVPHRAPGQPSVVTIAMRLWVSPEGHIDAVQVISADPALPWVDSLLQNIHQTPLRPAYQQGRPVASSWLVEWQLDLSGSL